MFPIPWNFPFRKKNGDMSTIGDVIGGGGSDLPPHSASDAGKLLGVKLDGSLEWSDEVSSEIQTLANDIDTINGKLEDAYKFIGSHIFSATHDGTKTWNTLAHECLEQMKTYLSDNHDRAFMLRSITLKAVAGIPLNKPQLMDYTTSDHGSTGFVLRTNASGAVGYDINLYDNTTKIATLSFTTAPAFSVNNTWGENTVATNGVDLILDEYVILS